MNELSDDIKRRKATGDICHFKTNDKQYFCHHIKGFGCLRCIKLIRGA